MSVWTATVYSYANLNNPRQNLRIPNGNVRKLHASAVEDIPNQPRGRQLVQEVE